MLCTAFLRNTNEMYALNFGPSAGREEWKWLILSLDHRWCTMPEREILAVVQKDLAMF